MGLFRTIDDIVGNPYRSRGWKVFDISLLTVLWGATAICILWVFAKSWDEPHHVIGLGGQSRMPRASKLEALRKP